MVAALTSQRAYEMIQDGVWEPESVTIKLLAHECLITEETIITREHQL